MSQENKYLRRAALRGRTRTVHKYLMLGCDVNSEGHCGNTALHLAALHNHGHTCKMLRKAGADVTRRNREGLTPLDMTDHMDVTQPHIPALRKVLSKEVADKQQYINKLRMAERMDWVDRDRPSLRQQLKLKKKFHWTDNPSPALLHKKKKAYDQALSKYLGGLGPKPPPLVLRPTDY